MPRRQRKNDTGENNATSSNSTSSSRRRGSDIPVMQMSDQTDAERRALRLSQRELAKSISNMEGIEDVHSGKFNEVREKNNALWNEVRYTREAVLDGDNLEMIGSRASRQVDKLISVPRYDADRLIAKLRAKCRRQDDDGGGGIDWAVLGLEVGSCFNAIPSRVSFLAGPIQLAKDYRPKDRKKPTRRSSQENDAEEEEPEEVHQKSKNKTDEDKLSAVERQMSTMRKSLIKKCELRENRALNTVCDEYGLESIEELDKLDDGKKKSVKKKARSYKIDTTCAVKFLFNPKSFTQTVENMFNMSFMVKHSQGEIGIRSLEDCKALGIDDDDNSNDDDDDDDDPFRPKPGPYVKPLDPKKVKVKVNRPARQAVVALNMRDWRDMCRTFGVVKGDLPHRANSKYSCQVNPSPS